MTVEIRFVDEAVSDVHDAALWYPERRDGLRLAFLAALDSAVESIMRWPAKRSLG